MYAVRRDLTAVGFSADGARAIVAAFSELADNVWDHSLSDVPGLVGYRLTPSRVTFCIADVGVGVLESLRQNPQFTGLSTSASALAAALKPGVSRFADPTRGYGFRDLLTAVAEQWGLARLRTGEAKLLIDHTTEDRTRRVSYAPPLPGLQIVFSCGTKAPKRQLLP